MRYIMTNQILNVAVNEGPYIQLPMLAKEKKRKLFTVASVAD
jgi:hypothetical protein